MRTRWLAILLATGCGMQPLKLDGVSDGSPDAGLVLDGHVDDIDASVDVPAIVIDAQSAVAGWAIEPAVISVPAGRNQIFVANAAVTWSVSELGGGTIDAAGMYVAPDVPGTYHVLASDATGLASATVVVEQMNVMLLTGGLGGFGNADGVGDDARFSDTFEVAFDGARTLYIADGFLIRTLDLATNEVGTLAGGGTGAQMDGVGTSARFTRTFGLALDPTTSTLYVADNAETIRAIDLATRTVTTIAGHAYIGGTTNGPGLEARFRSAHGMCIEGSTLYIADASSHTIRTLDLASPDHEVALLAGQPDVHGNADSSDPWTASFYFPTDVACTPTTLYVADFYNNSIRTIDRATGTVGTLVGSPATPYGDGDVTTAGLSRPMYLEVDPSHSRIFVGDWNHGVIRTIDLAAHSVTTLVGDPGVRGWRDGVGNAALLWAATGMVTDGTTLWFVESFNYNVRAVDLASATVTTLAGVTHAPSGTADGTFGHASFRYPSRLAADAVGNLFVEDDFTIRKLSLALGTVQHVAGQAGVQGRQDGEPQVATLAVNNGLLANPDGTVWACDYAAIRSIASDGSVTTPYGQPFNWGEVDGVGTAALFHAPAGMVRVGGKVIVADLIGYTIRQIDPLTGQVTTLVGMPGVRGHTDGPGITARLEGPYALATDGDHTVWIGEWGTYAGATIRELDLSTNTLTTIAGASGVLGDLEDGIGPAAHFSGPTGLAYDGHGSLYVADTGADRFQHGTALIRRIWIPSRAVSTYAGVRGRFGGVPGPVQSTTLGYPAGLAITPSGELVFTAEAGILSIVRE